MIFTDISEIKPYIPTSMLNITYLTAHENRACLKHLPKYLGIDLTKAILGANPDAATLALIEQLKPVIANLAYLEAVPFIDLVSTKTGFGVVNNSTNSPASAQRVQNFKEACLKAAEDYLSDALLFLELNANDYPAWNKSSLIEGGLISSIDSWPREIDINYSRVKFVNLVPALREVERLWIKKQLSNEFVADIAPSGDLNVLPDLQKALAYMASFRNIPEKEKPNHTELQVKAFEFLNSCIDFLNKNLESYPVYVEYGYSEPFKNDLDNLGFFKMG